MSNIRRNGIVGMFDYKEGLTDVSLHFSEWWNGEGMDFDFNDQKKFALHLDELHSLAVAAVATGMIDIDDVKKDADALNEESRRRSNLIRDFNKQYGYNV